MAICSPAKAHAGRGKTPRENFKSADLDRAISFYAGTLELSVLQRREIMPGVEDVRFEAGGGILSFESGDPQGKTNDLVGWDV